MPLLQALAGQKIIFEGRPAAATFLIISGEVELFTIRLAAKRMVARLGAGDILGEIELLTGTPSQLSALAARDCTLLPIPAEEFGRHLKETDPIIIYLLKLMAQRLSNMTTEFTLNKLSAAGQRRALDLSAVSSEFGSWLRANESEHDRMLRRRCQAGETIFRIGEPSDYAYIMLEGEAGVFLPSKEDKTLVPLAKIGAGELFGEMALLEKRPRSATIIASSDCQLMRLEAAEIHARLAHGDPLLAYWLQSLLKRLRHMQKLLQSRLAPNAPTPANLLAPEPLPENVRTAMINDFQLADELRQLTAHGYRPAPNAQNMPKAGQATVTASKQPADVLKKKRETAAPVRPASPLGRMDYVILPIVKLKEYTIEALRVRPAWRHPAQGIIQARRIYELAQKMWLEPLLDKAAIGFCKQNMPAIWSGRSHFTMQPDSLMLIVPMRSNLDDPDPLLSEALKQLAAAMPPDRVILELEEGRLAVTNPEQIRRTLAGLREQGFRLMISYSEGEPNVLKMLQRHPIDYLRLRPELTAALVSGRDAKMIETMGENFRRLAEGQGLHVWADGIAQLEAEYELRKMGIEAASGPLYSRHMTLNETGIVLVQKKTLIFPPSIAAEPKAATAGSM